MISGLNQEVHVFGKAFHFQTELTRKGDLYARTEIFVGGKVVATREHRLEHGDRLDDESLRALMKKHHNRVIERTLERIRRYQETKRPASQQPATLPAFDSPNPEDFAPPSDEVRQAAAGAVRIRRIFGRFRLRLGLGEEVAPEQLAERLETASRGFTWILNSPTFQELRLDEQIRCHLASEQVRGWLAGERDVAKAKEIWAEIAAFEAQVTAINNRAELRAFDRQLLTWAAYRVQSEGMSAEIFDQLQWLAGRDPELDGLLDSPDDVPAETWFAVLCHVLAQTPRATAS